MQVKRWAPRCLHRFLRGAGSKQPVGRGAAKGAAPFIASGCPSGRLRAEYKYMKSVVLGSASAPEAGSTVGLLWLYRRRIRHHREPLLPNPSLESRPREAGRLGPAAGSQAHCRLPAQGVLPHGSAQLER